MNKSDLINAIFAETEVSKKDCEAVLKAFTDAVISAVANGEKVSLVGFGSFSVVERQARSGRNPATGQVIQIPAKKVPKFTPGKEFRDSLA
ncbi:MAG: HU family DNA-binding protein [Candidatus Hatepunaea meridiana]|nr:HU family DNA-binding protein [Candidatus Hatepunaea meridiana]